MGTLFSRMEAGPSVTDKTKNLLWNFLQWSIVPIGCLFFAGIWRTTDLLLICSIVILYSTKYAWDNRDNWEIKFRRWEIVLPFSLILVGACAICLIVLMIVGVSIIAEHWDWFARTISVPVK